MMILLLFLQKQNLAFAVYLFGSVLSFLTGVHVRTSGRINGELLRLLLSNKQADYYFAALGYEAHKEEFCHRHCVFFYRNQQRPSAQDAVASWHVPRMWSCVAPPPRLVATSPPLAAGRPHTSPAADNFRWADFS